MEWSASLPKWLQMNHDASFTANIKTEVKQTKNNSTAKGPITAKIKYTAPSPYNWETDIVGVNGRILKFQDFSCFLHQTYAFCIFQLR